MLVEEGTDASARWSMHDAGPLADDVSNFQRFTSMSVTELPVYRPSLESSEVNITEAAREQLVRLFDDVDDDEVEAIRIFVSGGGCSGMTYGMTFADKRTPYDKVLEEQGFKVYVDSVALGFVRGVEIDYVSKPTGATFVFNNVFAATGGSGTCGACGAAGGGCG